MPALLATRPPIKRRPLLGAALLLPALLLTGCATPRSTPDNAGARIQGRLSVQTAGAQGGSSSFELLGSAEAGQLELSTPLGSLLARARWAAGSPVLLETPEGQRQFDDLDALSHELLGEAIPVAALFDWLQGRPWPLAEAQPLPAPARGFLQLGWRIELDRFAEAGLLLARRLAEPAVTLRARIDR